MVTKNINKICGKIDGILFSFEDDLKLIVENLFQDEDYLQKLSESSYHKVMNRNSLELISKLDNRILYEYKI